MSRWKPVVTMVVCLAVVGCKKPEPAVKKEPEQTAEPVAEKALEKAKELAVKAQVCLAMGDLEGAKQAAEEALVLEADLKEAKDLLAKVELERAEKAEKRQKVEASKPEEEVAVLFEDARKLADAKNYVGAHAKLQELLKLAPGRVDAKVLAAKVVDLRRQKEASLVRTRKLAGLRKEAARLVAARDWQRAEHLCKQVVELSHTQREKAEARNRVAYCKAIRLYQLGRKAFEKAQYKDAATHLRESLEARKIAAAESLLARARREQQKKERAERDRKRFQLLIHEARAFEDQGEVGQAIERYREAVGLAAAGDRVAEARGALDKLSKEIEYRGCIKKAEEALSADEPDYSAAISQFFKAEKIRGELPPELQEKARGAMFRVCARQGDEAMGAGNYAEAITHYEDALACHEDETVAARKAEAETRKAADDFAVLVAEAQGLFEQKNTAAAADPLERAVSIAEERPEFIDANELARARNDLKRAAVARERRLNAQLKGQWRQLIAEYKKVTRDPRSAIQVLSANRDTFAGSRYERSLDKLLGKMRRKLERAAAREWSIVQKEINGHPDDHPTNALLLRGCLEKVRGVEEYELRVLEALQDEEPPPEAAE